MDYQPATSFAARCREVHIVALPFFGIVSEILPVFSRKPLFGYKSLVFATIAIGLLSAAVWAHHMYATGARPDEQRRLQSRCALSAASHGRADHRRDQAHPKRCRHTVGGAPESWVVERKERPSWSPLSRSRARPSHRCP
jgi:hypothetical protein